MSFEARFFSDCSACGWRIKPGDRARYAGDEVVHLECPEDQPLHIVREVCSVCFSEKSAAGTCLCE